MVIESVRDRNEFFIPSIIARLVVTNQQNGAAARVKRKEHAIGPAEHEADIKIRQALLRNADIRTTMNIYTQVVARAVREANRKVVKNILGKQGGIDAAVRVPEATKSFQISTGPTS
jgi:hypothetical protein